MKSKITSIFLSITLGSMSLLTPANAVSLPGLNMVVRGNLNYFDQTPPYNDSQSFDGICLTDVVNNIDFNWGDLGPFNCPIDFFSTYFYGYIKAPITGKVYFYDQSDDGFYMTLNGQEVISDWELQGIQNPNGSGSFDMIKDQIYFVKIWNYEYSGGAAVRLFWNLSNSFDSASIVPNACFSTDGTVWSGTCSLSAPPPSINNLTVNIGSTLGGTLTTIFGANLSGVKNVKIGGANATLGFNTSTSISVVTPPNTAGLKDVSVITDGGTATKVAAFTYCDYKGKSSNVKNAVGSAKSASPAYTQSQGAGACQNSASR